MSEESNNKFQLETQFQPCGDQPEAIKSIVKAFEKGETFQTLLGVTGSGKTFTMANTIQKLGKKTLILAHNKTLASQGLTSFFALIFVFQLAFLLSLILEA